MWKNAREPGAAGMTPATPAAATPDEDVRAWRRQRLERAGLKRDEALELAASDVDLHALIGLLERGCPPHLAARIVAPLDVEEAP
jgi:hypothetical protein